MSASWQWIVIVAIEAAAIVFLARRMFGRDGAQRPKKRGPDVPVRSLVRKKIGSTSSSAPAAKR